MANCVILIRQKETSDTGYKPHIFSNLVSGMT